MRDSLTSISSSPRRGRVLLTDDDPLVRRAMTRFLVASDYEVELAEDGQAALARLAEVDFDVLITDICMPGATGVEVLRQIRAMGIELPVVLMTGQPATETALDAIELGAIAYLEKPVSAAVLLPHLDRGRKLRDVARLQRKLREESERARGDRVGVEERFDRALESIHVVFQPVIRWSTRSVLGWEAFVRSSEPTMQRPRELLGAAERLDRMRELGRRVREKCAASWEKAPDGAVLFLNLHPMELSDPELVSPGSPLAPFADRVVLELTERACLGRVRDGKARIDELRSRGFRIAVDDIADGYASLKTLAALEPDFLKLDRSLVDGVHQAKMKSRLVAAFARLCDDLGTCLVAESVETPAELERLSELGCDHFQGHLFARPGDGFPEPEFPQSNDQHVAME